MTTPAQELLKAAARANTVVPGRVAKLHGGGGLRPGCVPYQNQNLSLQQQAKIAFEEAPSIRAEFGTFGCYLAYRRWADGQPACGGV